MEISFEQAMETINGTGKYGTHPGSENAARLLKALGHPEKSLSIIHVAGTNGKGSVCSFLADLLTACGYKTGLFTSPHLVDARERIQLNREWIGKEDFARCFSRVQEAIDLLAAQDYKGITYFDYFFAVAMCYYAEKQVDFVVMETGLGGAKDSTNAVAHPLLSIITSISFDHTEVLGDTLAKIAAEKAGIIKPKTPLIYCADEPEVCAVMESAADAAGIRRLGIRRGDCTRLSLENGKLAFRYNMPIPQQTSRTHTLSVESCATYQMENAAIAYTAALYLLGCHKIPTNLPDLPFQTAIDAVPETVVRTLKNALSRSRWEGRMEQVRPGIYLDGAHNADGIRMLLESLRLAAKDRPAILLFAAVKEKDTEEMIREICESGLFDQYLLTTVGGPRAIAPEILKEQFRRHTNLPADTFISIEEAFFAGANAAKRQDSILLAAGSLYLVGRVKALLSDTFIGKFDKE